jgi:hypothetical protein
LSIQDFEDGKLITEIATMETYYLEQDVFDLLRSAAEQYIEAMDLLPAGYPEEEYIQFIQELIEKRILLSKE